MGLYQNFFPFANIDEVVFLHFELFVTLYEKNTINKHFRLEILKKLIYKQTQFAYYFLTKYVNIKTKGK